MPIALPYTFTNGQIADAAQVNANFNAVANGALSLTGGVITGPLNLSAIGAPAGPWIIQSAAGGNPANPWNLTFSQAGVQAMRMWSSNNGGVNIYNELFVVNGTFNCGGIRADGPAGNFFVQSAVNPPNPQSAAGLMGLNSLAVWDNTTQALTSMGNRSTGITGTWNAGNNLIIVGTPNVPYFMVTRANGTAAAPTMPGAGYILGEHVWSGYTPNWTTTPWAGRISCETTEAWTATGYGTRMNFYTTPNGAVGSALAATIENDGNFTITGATATKPGSTAWVNPSDPRLKSSMEPYNVGLEQVLRLHPIRYRYNGQGPLQGYTGEHVGLDADHVAEVMPSLHGSVEYEGESYGTVDTGELVYTMLNAIKELAAEVAALKTRSASNGPIRSEQN